MDIVVLSVIIGIVGLAVTPISFWLRSVAARSDQVHESIGKDVVGPMRSSFESQLSAVLKENARLREDLAGMRSRVEELSGYIKHNATDLWRERDRLLEQVAALNGKTDHLSAEVTRICKEA